MFAMLQVLVFAMLQGLVFAMIQVHMCLLCYGFFSVCYFTDSLVFAMLQVLECLLTYGVHIMMRRYIQTHTHSNQIDSLMRMVS